MSFLIEPKLFAANMRYYRERQSYTIAALAQHTNLTTTYRSPTCPYRVCSKSETGRSGFTPST